MTFVFADLEGSTRLLRRLGDRYAAVLTRYRELADDAYRSGVVFGVEGDAIFAAFSSAAAAVDAAADLQRRLAAEPYPEGEQLVARVGVHTGTPRRLGNDYVGLDVHQVARICSAAHGGQVVVSMATEAQIGPRGPNGVSLRSLGSYRLKDFDEAQTLYQLVVDDLPSSFPPLRTARPQVVALPTEMTTMVGRDAEQSWLLSAVAEHRVLTLIGPGGVGKSKLAVRTARNAAPRFEGTVAFVPLAQLDDVEHVPGAIARAVGTDGVLGSWEDVRSAFADQHALFVVDNAEHLPGLGDELEAWAARSERVHLLITSRAPLGISGERVFPLEPLGGDEAAALLAERVRERQPDFTETPERADALRAIAARLDGLPLAVELAAARVHALPPDAMVKLLDRQMDLLSDRSSGRHGSMRRTIQWSYDLLPDDSAGVFRRLSAFASPATLTAVAATSGVDQLEALESLEQLIDTSLVRLGGTEALPRYWMLEPIKQFARDCLIRAGEDGQAERAVADWLLAEARERSPSAGGALLALRGDIETIHRVLATHIAEARWAAALELAERLLDGVILPLGLFVQFRALIEQAIDHADPLDPADQARVGLLRSLFVGAEDRVGCLEHGYAAAGRAGSLQLMAHNLGYLMVAHGALNDVDALEEALERARRLRAPPELRLDMAILAAEVRVRSERQGWDAGYAETVLLHCRRSPDPLDVPTMFNAIAWMALGYGDAEFALAPAEEAALSVDRMGLAWYSQVIRHTAALAALALDRPETARVHVEAAVASMTICNPGADEASAVATAAAAVLAAFGDDIGAGRLLGAIPLDAVREDPDCRWEICEPYLLGVEPGQASADQGSVPELAITRLEKLPERIPT